MTSSVRPQNYFGFLKTIGSQVVRQKINNKYGWMCLVWASRQAYIYLYAPGDKTEFSLFFFGFFLYYIWKTESPTVVKLQSFFQSAGEKSPTMLTSISHCSQ